jgi:hypothetical protein
MATGLITATKKKANVIQLDVPTANIYLAASEPHPALACRVLWLLQ